MTHCARPQDRDWTLKPPYEALNCVINRWPYTASPLIWPLNLAVASRRIDLLATVLVLVSFQLIERGIHSPHEGINLGRDVSPYCPHPAMIFRWSAASEPQKHGIQGFAIAEIDVELFRTRKLLAKMFTKCSGRQSSQLRPLSWKKVLHATPL